LKEEALDRTLWKTRFGRDCRPVERQTAEWMKEWMNVTDRTTALLGCRPNTAYSLLLCNPLSVTAVYLLFELNVFTFCSRNIYIYIYI
jgi:hypothetical protein